MTELLTIDAGGDSNRTYLLFPEGGGALCVDPSYAGPFVLEACASRGRRLTEILLTHTHADHIASVPDLVRTTGSRVWVHRLEQRSVWGAVPLPREGPIPGLPEVEAVFAPGHTPGGTCYRIGDDLFTGDVLFVDWVGRSDFSGGDCAALFASLAKLRTLPGGLTIRPGHHYGSVESRTLAEEVLRNKFLACTDYAAFLKMVPELSE